MHAYRSLLVHLDTRATCAARTELAIALAKRFDCHLVGLAPSGLIGLPRAIVGAEALDRYATLAWDDLREQAAETTARFRDACIAAGLASFRALADDADEAHSLLRHARYSDLTILGQADPAARNHCAARAIVEQVTLHGARPNLLLPYAGRIEPPGERVMVAWDESREAARAVADALPWLQRARQVRLVSWSEGIDPDEATLHERLDALRRWLAWHGVADVEARVERAQGSIADAMLSCVADWGADLIVMGAYGHARWSERVLGGATRGMLASMTVPVLMSR